MLSKIGETFPNSNETATIFMGERFVVRIHGHDEMSKMHQPLTSHGIPPNILCEANRSMQILVKNDKLLSTNDKMQWRKQPAQHRCR